MADRHRATREFWHLYRVLPQDVRDRADKQFALLRLNPQHPSLQFKKVKERPSGPVWSVRVTLNYRALAIARPDGFVWVWIGDHKTYDDLLR